MRRFDHLVRSRPDSTVWVIESRNIRVLDSEIEHAMPQVNVDALDALLVVRVMTLVGVRRQHIRCDRTVEVQRVAYLSGERDRRALYRSRSDNDRNGSRDYSLHRADRTLNQRIHERALPRTRPTRDRDTV